MKPKERQLKIIDKVRKEGTVTVEQLVTLFNASAETIRRDLGVLASSGKIQKIHGGAKFSNFQGEGPFQHRMRKNVAEKRQIAEKACQLITSGDTLLINAGSTTVILAEELSKFSKLTIVTNSLDIAKIIGNIPQNTNQVYLLGGEYSHDNQQTLGAMTIAQLQQFHVQHAILPIGHIDAVVGVTDFDGAGVAVAQAMLEHAENVTLLADSSKYNKTAPFVLGRLDQFDRLICDEPPTGALYDALIKNNVEILY